MLNLISPKEGEEVSLATVCQEMFCSPEEYERRKTIDGSNTNAWYALERSGGDRSTPSPVHFEWHFEEDPVTPDDQRGGLFYLLVSKQPDLSAPIVTATAGMQADVWNLEIGAKYWYCVQKEGKRSEIRSFRTRLLAPRCLLVEGVSNFRDLGGYPVGDRRIRQGLLIRGGEPDIHMHITEQGLRRLQALGIRTELDLRGMPPIYIDHAITPLYGIRRVLIPVRPYEEIFADDQIEGWHAVFQLLADPANYPIYHHCWGGADRGGSLAFLVGALLGMTEDWLDFDYEYTSLAIWGIRTRNFEPYVQMKKTLRTYPGSTLQEQVASFLKLRWGVTEEEISSIRSILLGRDPVIHS